MKKILKIKKEITTSCQSESLLHCMPNCNVVKSARFHLSHNVLHASEQSPFPPTNSIGAHLNGTPTQTIVGQQKWSVYLQQITTTTKQAD